MRRKSKSWRKLAIGVVLTLTAWSGVEEAYAEVVYTYQPQSTGNKVVDPLSYVSGKHMVWTSSDAEGYLQVFYQNIVTSEIKQITTFASQKHSPKVSEAEDGKVYILWVDGREYEAQNKWEMYAQELATGQEWKLAAAIEKYQSVELNGSEVVGQNKYSLEMVYYSLISNTEIPIGKGRFPKVAKGKVVFLNEKDGGISMYDTASSTTKPVLQLPYHLNVTAVAFDGQAIAYKQADLDNRTHYVWHELNKPNSQPVALSTPMKQAVPYSGIYMSAGQIAFVSEQQGKPVLKGYSVGDKMSYTIAEGDLAERTIGWVDGKLVQKDVDGNLYLGIVTRTESSGSESGGGGGAVVPVQVVTSEVKARIGMSGGELKSHDGFVKLTVPKNALGEETEVRVRKHEERTEMLGKNETGVRTPASSAYQIEIDGKLQAPMKLQFTNRASDLTSLQREKLIVYKYDELERSWKPLGGRWAADSSGVMIDVSEGGTYALLLNDVTFADSQSHWGRQYIEVLASRNVVDGTTSQQFEPDGVLTRAQFTKMLLGAMQIEASTGSSPSFQDVARDHWASGWIEAAVKAGVVQGDDELFRPDAELTREQMMAMLVRAMGAENQAQAMTSAELDTLLTYTDSEEVSAWARPYAAYTTKLGMIEGDGGAVRPHASSNRAQSAAVVYRLLKQMGKL